MSNSLEQPLDHDTTATAGPDSRPEAPPAGDTGDDSSSGCEKVGDVTRALKDVFAKARESAPYIVFIDELDSLPRRDSDSKRAEWWESLVNALLQELES